MQWPSARDGGRRIGASADLGWPSGTLSSSAIPVTAVPWQMVPTSLGWSSHRLPTLFAAAGRSAQEPVQGADEGFGPYGDTVGPVHLFFVGADLRVGPCEGDEGHKPSRVGRSRPPSSTSRHNCPGSA